MSLFEKPLFTFEMANNHQGSVEHGLRIIKELERVTADYRDAFDFAVKFQYRDLDTFIHPDYKGREDIKNVKRFQDTRLTEEQFLTLKKAVEEAGFFTMCTAFDERSVDRIVKHGYDIIKIASCSFRDWPLLEKVATVDLPIIASGAGSNMEEVDRFLSFFEHRNKKIALMHCVAEYPTPNEHLQMNQITLYKNRYPSIPIGFSTHEAPDNMEPIKMAVAKGAVIFEKHVGVPTDTITLNGYSANPEQVAEWLKAAKEAYKMCGVEGRRYVPTEKEKSDLEALERGVFARGDVNSGTSLDNRNVFYAFPRIPGQLTASDMSKYKKYVVKKDFKANEPIMKSDADCLEERGRVKEIVTEVMKLLKKGNVVVPKNSSCSISHHYGLDRYEEVGVTIIDCINREYCKKLLIVLPGQSHPTHYHKLKEETFTVLYGTLDVVADGVASQVIKGESMVVERGVAHSFASKEGCVFEEISTTHYANDSFYEKESEFVSPRKTSVYLTSEMLEELVL